jgi:hypothetical protein
MNSPYREKKEPNETYATGAKNPGFATNYGRWTDDFIKAMTKEFRRWVEKQNSARGVECQKKLHDNRAKDVLKKYTKR